MRSAQASHAEGTFCTIVEIQWMFENSVNMHTPTGQRFAYKVAVLVDGHLVFVQVTWPLPDVHKSHAKRALLQCCENCVDI